MRARDERCAASGGCARDARRCSNRGARARDPPGAARDDKMETFWLVESLKYFLLLFSDDSLLDLNTHVLNTEAHPLRVLPD